MLPAGSRIYNRYQNFLGALPEACDRLGLDADDLIYNDYTTLVVGWLKQNPW